MAANADELTATQDIFDVEARDAIGRPVFAVDDNRLRFLYHPEDRFDAIITLIRSAKESIRAFYYMVVDDESGTAVVDELCAATERGVKVSFGIDSFGSGDTDIAWFDRLKECGVDFFCFSSRRSRRYLIRNHQKILIVDSGTALVGGYNIRDSYFCRGTERHWEDLGVVIRGDRAEMLCRYYDEFKTIAADGRSRLRDVRRLIVRWIGKHGPLCWTMGGPTTRLSPWALKLKHDIEVAERASIVSAYFTPGRAMVRRMGRVAKRGALTLMLAGKSDNQTTIRASRLFYKYFAKRGAEVFEYQARCLHMKLLVIDDISYVGSANLDLRSLYVNIEIMLRIESADVADHLRTLVVGMKAEADPQTLPAIKQNQHFYSRPVHALSYLLVGVLDYTVSRRFGFPFKRDPKR